MRAIPASRARPPPPPRARRTVLQSARSTAPPDRPPLRVPCRRPPCQLLNAEAGTRSEIALHRIAALDGPVQGRLDVAPEVRAERFEHSTSRLGARPSPVPLTGGSPGS